MFAIGGCWLLTVAALLGALDTSHVTYSLDQWPGAQGKRYPIGRHQLLIAVDEIVPLVSRSIILIYARAFEGKLDAVVAPL